MCRYINVSGTYRKRSTGFPDVGDWKGVLAGGESICKDADLWQATVG